MIWLTEDERHAAQSRLEEEYAGVFGPAEIAFHLDAHVAGGFADYACQVIAAATPAGGRILDVGAGYGSFVVLARERGFDAIGTEISPFEIAFSRNRLARLRPMDRPETVFLDQGIFNGLLDRRSFDAVTLWNVLEHIEDVRPILRRAAELLVPGGAIYIVCPNYAAWRREAHYQVPWHPFLTRAATIRRLERHGKDPRFFSTSVFRRTNWAVMRELRRNGLRLYDRMNQRAMTVATLFANASVFLDFYNPVRASVELSARKPK